MADLKITELAALTVVNNEDLIAIVDDPTGTASTKKIRTDDFQSGWHVGARVYHDANIDCPSGEWVALSFNSERYDTDGIHSAATGTFSRLTCQTSGKYLIIGNILWHPDTAARRILQINLNGDITIGIVEYSVVASEKMNVSSIYDLEVGNYVGLWAYQNSGGALPVIATAQYSPEFMMQRIG